MSITLNDPANHFANQNKVSGCFRAKTNSEEFELRIDIDRPIPFLPKMISGDYFKLQEGTLNYQWSFQTSNLQIQPTESAISISGNAVTNTGGALRIEIDITQVSPIGSPLTPLAEVKVTFDDVNTPVFRFHCHFESPFFRTVEFEQDMIEGLELGETFEIRNVPGSGPQTLSIISAFEKAGIKLHRSRGIGIISKNDSEKNPSWNLPELNAAMKNHFYAFRNEPQWKLWLFVTTKGEAGMASWRGVMFDQEGKHRQGCAIFHDLIRTDEEPRKQLRTLVHEIGHCFNLLHCWEEPPNARSQHTRRPDALSWMNDPGVFGKQTYWEYFPFQFDKFELTHLRHGAYLDVVMGGNNFEGSISDIMTLPSNPTEFPLQLEIKPLLTKLRFAEPVFVELKLSTSQADTRVYPSLHPNSEIVKIFIGRTSEQFIQYEPIVKACVDMSPQPLTPDNPMQELVYIGYGKDGYYFDQPGEYFLQATYFAPDGNTVRSSRASLIVNPQLPEDEEVTKLFSREHQGELLYFYGSDPDPDWMPPPGPNTNPYEKRLYDGNKTFRDIITVYPNHPFAMYARLVLGINAQRNFKTIAAENKIMVRKAKYQKSFQLLIQVWGVMKRVAMESLLFSKMIARLIWRAVRERLNQFTGSVQLETNLISPNLLLSFNLEISIEDFEIIKGEAEHFQHPFTFWFPKDSDPQ